MSKSFRNDEDRDSYSRDRRNTEASKDRRRARKGKRAIDDRVDQDVDNYVQQTYAAVDYAR